MKKLCLFLVSLSLLLSFLGCRASNSTMTSSTSSLPKWTFTPSMSTEKEVIYLPAIYDDFDSPYTTEEMCSMADAIVKGKITSVTFYYRNFLPKPEEEWDDVIVCTTYTLEIQHAYFGDISGTITYSVPSGLPEVCLDEQMAIVEKYGLFGINTIRGMSYPELNKEYMFILKQAGDKIRIVTYNQYLHEIDENEVVTDPTIPSYKSILDYLSKSADNSINTND